MPQKDRDGKYSGRQAGIDPIDNDYTVNGSKEVSQWY
jgi:hypothetical protein